MYGSALVMFAEIGSILAIWRPKLWLKLAASPRPYASFSYKTAARLRPMLSAKCAMVMPLLESLEITRNTQGEMPVSSGVVADVAIAGSRPASYTFAAATIAPDVTCPTTPTMAGLATKSCAMPAALAPSAPSSRSLSWRCLPRTPPESLTSAMAISIPFLFMSPNDCANGPATPSCIVGAPEEHAPAMTHTNETMSGRALTAIVGKCCGWTNDAPTNARAVGGRPPNERIFMGVDLGGAERTLGTKR